MAPRRLSGEAAAQLAVGQCRIQSGEERFGDNVKKVIHKRERLVAIQDGGGLIDDDDGLPDGLQVSLENLEGEQQPRIPKMQLHRTNLTVLSQKYNVYIVAYEGKLHVYRPMGMVTQALPKEPDLIIDPKPSPCAAAIGGYLDRKNPHQVNNLATGFFGQEEIVVAVYDDGDVVAHYIKDIAHCSSLPKQDKDDERQKQDTVKERQKQDKGKEKQRKVQNTEPKPYLRSNVGLSAWGIAIHDKSRLFAVSSNSHEVTVFAPALEMLCPEAKRSFDIATDPTEQAVLARKRNWRIIIRFGSTCSNIPSIAFLDDKYGQAIKVVAQDIAGNCWIADIWKPRTRVIRYGHNVGQEVRNQQAGWGVLTLSENCLQSVDTRDDFIGRDESLSLDINRSIPESWLNITNSLRHVVDHPAPPATGLAPLSIGNNDDHGGDDDDDEEEEDESNGDESGEDEEEDVEMVEEVSDVDSQEGSGDPDLTSIGHEHGESTLITWTPTTESAVSNASPFSIFYSSGFPESPHAPVLPLLAQQISVPGDATGTFEDTNDMIYTPHDGNIFAAPTTLKAMLLLLRGDRTYNESRTPQDPKLLSGISKRYVLLRTYERDVELRSLDANETNVYCLDPLNHQQWSRHATYRWSRRTNLLAQVPELSLVVVGSLTGRVALITPTRRRPNGKAGTASMGRFEMQRAFRIERVLPSAKDEKAGLGVKKPLYGMAIGPVQARTVRKGMLLGDMHAPTTSQYRTYRLMLHYRDHSIHTYLISRDGGTNQLFVDDEPDRESSEEKDWL